MPPPSEQPEPLDIEIQQAARTELPEGLDPAEDDSLRLVQLGCPGQDPRVFMAYVCLKQMLAHTQRNLDDEIAGILVGRIFRSSQGLVTVLAEAVAAAYTESGMGHVTFSHETWEEMYQYLESLACDAEIVGWYHTHPGFGVFFSGQDRFIQQNFFSALGQVGIVVDPIAKSVLLFECQDGEVAELGGIWVTAGAETYRAAQRLLAGLCYGERKPAPQSWVASWGRRLRGILSGKQPTEASLHDHKEA